MKKLLFAAFICINSILSSCSNDNNFTSENSVEGRWKLVNSRGTFAGINNNFTYGLITWDFNSITQTVTVINNNTDPNLLDILETGVYNYQFINNPDSPCGESIEIDGSVLGCYSIINDSLVIDQSIADGFAITLKR